MERAAGSTEPLIHNHIAAFHPSKRGSHPAKTQKLNAKFAKTISSLII